MFVGLSVIVSVSSGISKSRKLIEQHLEHSVSTPEALSSSSVGSRSDWINFQNFHFKFSISFHFQFRGKILHDEYYYEFNYITASGGAEFP